MPTREPDPAGFMALLDRCKKQVEADPSGYLDNPHLHEELLRIINWRRCRLPAKRKHPGKKPDLAAFIFLLDRCKRQLKRDPSGYLMNANLHDSLLHRIYLDLCHGNIPDHGIPEAPHADA